LIGELRAQKAKRFRLMQVATDRERRAGHASGSSPENLGQIGSFTAKPPDLLLHLLLYLLASVGKLVKPAL
jgi:hypothetical protein